MKKTNITSVGFQRKNFVGYELDENVTLNLKQCLDVNQTW